MAVTNPLRSDDCGSLHHTERLWGWDGVVSTTAEHTYASLVVCEHQCCIVSIVSVVCFVRVASWRVRDERPSRIEMARPAAYFETPLYLRHGYPKLVTDSAMH